MCHTSEFQKILESNYTKIGLSLNVKFSLGKWLGTRQKIIQCSSQKTQNHASGYQVGDQTIIAVLAYFFSSKRQHY